MGKEHLSCWLILMGTFPKGARDSATGELLRHGCVVKAVFAAHVKPFDRDPS